MEDTVQDERKLYEITVLGAAEDFLQPKALIGKFGGVIEEEKPQGKVRFAYPLKKQSYGFLGFFKVKLAPQSVGQLSGELKLDDSVFRFLVHTPHAGVGTFAATRPQRPTFRRDGVNAKPKSNVPPALTNEAIEKKIEEILQ